MVAYAFWLRERYTPMMWAFIAAVAIFRAELVLLFVPILVSALYKGRVSLRTVITTGVFASAAYVNPCLRRERDGERGKGGGDCGRLGSWYLCNDLSH